MIVRAFSTLALLGAFLAASVSQAAVAGFADLAEKQKPAVVNISTTQIARGAQAMPPGFPFGSPFDDFFRDFFKNMPPQERHSLGSGFILSNDGYVVTNNHVVDNADEVIVKTSEGTEYKAKIVGTDPKLDLALLKIDGKNLPTVSLGDSDSLRVGDWVVAIGNPFGLEQTVTAGIVSAKGRVIGAGPYDSFIQTDAAINPGNSGGPLFDVDGRVVGINTAIFSSSGGNVGVGFAIPINMAEPVLKELREHGFVRRARLGVYIDAVDKETMKALGLPDHNGALVRQVEAGSAADKAGIQAGDVIVALDGEAIKRVHDLPIRVAQHKPGDKVRVDIFRGGKKQTIDVTVEEMPMEEVVKAGEGESRPSLGVSVRDLDRELAESLRTRVKYGVVVQQVIPGSPAHRAGIERGDVIYQINRQTVRDQAEFGKLVASLQPGDVLQIMLDRRGNQVFTILRLPKGQN